MRAVANAKQYSRRAKKSVVTVKFTLRCCEASARGRISKD